MTDNPNLFLIVLTIIVVSLFVTIGLMYVAEYVECFEDGSLAIHLPLIKAHLSVCVPGLLCD